MRCANRLEGGVGALAGIVQGRRPEGERPARRELSRQHGEPVLSGELRVRRCLLAQAVDQLADRVMVRVGVLADVERGQVQAEARQRAHRPFEPPVGDQLAAVLDQGRAHQFELGQQIRSAHVVAPRLVPPAARKPAPRVHELLLDAGELQAVGLLRVQPQEARLHLGEQLQVTCQRALQLRRRARDQVGRGQVAAQHVDDRDRIAQAVVVLEDEYAARGVGPHVRVAVAIAADPGAEGQRPRVGSQLESEPAELVGQLLEHVGHGVGMQTVEVPNRVAGLVDHVGLRNAQLVGLPEQVHRLLEPRGRTRVRPLEQLRDLAQLVEHGSAGGLGRVGGEHRPHAEPPHLGLDLRRGNLGRRDAIDGLREPASVARADVRQLPAAVHLLGHVGEVEVGGEGAHQLRGLGGLDVGKQCRSAIPIGADQMADALDLVEQLLALLAHERPPEQDPQLADLAAQPGLGVSSWRRDSCDRPRRHRGRRGTRAPR